MNARTRRRETKPSSPTAVLPNSLKLAPHRLLMERAGVDAPPAAAATPSVSDVLHILRDVYRKLVDLTDDEVQAMPVAERTAWAHFSDELFQDIRVLEISELKELNDEFKARLPELTDATARLSKAFSDLSDIVTAIKATTAVLSIVTD